METIVLYCKSYKKDVKRVVRLAHSIKKYNQERIPFYLSVPHEDLELFIQELASFDINFLTDEDILSRNSAGDSIWKMNLSGGMMQQIIKSEFWRMDLCENYLIIDSDTIFMRDFSATDFMYDEEIPFTVINESTDFRQFAARNGNHKVLGYYKKDRTLAMEQFGRKGQLYDFHIPCVWSRKVWETLDEKYAKPKNMNFADLIVQFPCEMLWYGEALLHYKSFPIYPREQLFKIFHYKDQYDEAIRLGENERIWAETFLGVVIQSSWQLEMDLERKKRRSWKTLWICKI